MSEELHRKLVVIDQALKKTLTLSNTVWKMAGPEVQRKLLKAYMRHFVGVVPRDGAFMIDPDNNPDDYNQPNDAPQDINPQANQ
jgi:hypothetical protein